MITRRTALLAGGGWLLAGLGVLPALERWAPSRAAGAFTTPDGATIDLDHHVLSRCGFGPRPGDRTQLAAQGGVDAWLETQLSPATIDDDACTRALARFDVLDAPAGELYEYKPGVVRRELVGGTLMRAVRSRRQLQERMVEVWRDWFSLSLGKGECAWLAPHFDREVLRAHALGRFADLVRASLRSPAMLWYLDGRENRADQGRCNENHARELLELHSLGVDGGYTQADVQAAARCLSGWTTRGLGQSRKGGVDFAAYRHDDGAKQVLGVTIPAGGGADDVERVVELVCAHPSTARRLARRLALVFIGDHGAPAAEATAVAAFTASNGDIATTLRALLTHADFRDPAVRGTRLRRPFDLVAASLRALDADSDAGEPLLAYLDTLGHAPYAWPTPDGYPLDAAHWRGGLLWRWRFAVDLCAGRIKGTRVDGASLLTRAGGEAGLAAHILGRAATTAETDAYRVGGLAALIAAPAFQHH